MFFYSNDCTSFETFISKELQVVPQPRSQSDYCMNAASNHYRRWDKIIPVATAAFNDSAIPNLGMVIFSVAI